MQSFIHTIKKSAISSLLLIVMLFLPVSGIVTADAADPAATATPCVAPPDTAYGNGVHRPNGADANLYTYQCDGPYAGQWTSAYYVYNPANNSKLPTYDPAYRYDCTAKQWYMTEWDFSASRNGYRQSTVATTLPAGTSTGCPVVQPSQAPSSSAAKTVDTNGDGIYDSPATPEAIAQAKANGGSMLDQSGNNTQNFTNATTVGLSNPVVSLANTGDASVTYNNLGGSAASGNASTMATIFNNLQTSSNVLQGQNMIMFTANINGDVNGDLLLDPSQLGSVQQANASTSLNNNVTVNNSVDSAINNNVNLGATSGTANVAYNNTGGDATSGSANAVANIINTLNSTLTAGRSFMGVININGNLNGDILLPPNFVDTLLASNVPHYTVNTADINTVNTVSNTNNQSINNAVNASAQSGNADVSHNNAAGSATSGSAKTNLTVFNLTGSDVVASNDLLVFVNVLGSWYGMIMNAPAGTTAASLGGGVSSNTTVNDNATLNNTNTQQINNNLTLTANSGNASVNHNNTGGDAKTGDTTASASIANILKSNLNLNGWFGLLFINVFGSWNGSFGVNTAAGDPVSTATATVDGVTVPAQMFGFLPNAANKTTKASSGSASSSATGSQGDASATQESGTVLAAHTSKTVAGTAVTPQLASGKTSYTIPIIGSLVALIILAASERKRFTSRHSAKV